MRMRLDKGTPSTRNIFSFLLFLIVFFISKKYNDQPSEWGRKKVRKNKLLFICLYLFLFVLICFFLFCRRVSVGCALINNPKVLLGDEVTSGLDSYSTSGLVGVLRSV